MKRFESRLIHLSALENSDAFVTGCLEIIAATFMRENQSFHDVGRGETLLQSGIQIPYSRAATLRGTHGFLCGTLKISLEKLIICSEM